jgi:hypothetical protein
MYNSDDKLLETPAPPRAEDFKDDDLDLDDIVAVSNKPL